MLPFFPKPYPNEDFRSIIYRYHLRSGNLFFEDTNNALFGVRSKRNTYFHHNIEVLVKLVNNKEYNIKYFLNNHTIFPLVKPFLSKKRREDYKDSIYKPNTLKSKKIWSNYIDENIKYCPKCVEVDFEKYGEVYAHRLHQIKFLNFCYVHQIELVSVCPDCGIPLSSMDGKVLLTKPCCTNGHKINMTDTIKSQSPPFIKRMIKDTLYLINNSNKINKELMIDLFYLALGNKGYVDLYSGHIHLVKLKHDFSAFLSNIQGKLKVEIYDVISSKFNFLFSKKNNNAPNILTFLLLIQLVSDSVSEFLIPSLTYSIDIPFKNTPQPCLNTTCEYFNKPVITKYKKTYYPIYVQGSFSCSNCGYTYGRKWIWSNDEKSGKVTKPFLITRGEFWEYAVLSLYKQGLSLRDMSNYLGIYKEPISKFLKEKLGSEYNERFNAKNNTLYKHLSRNMDELPLEHEDAYNELYYGLNEIAATRFDKRKFLIRRKNILNIINENTLFSRIKIKELARSDYIWLMKNDREWMEKVLPKSYKR